MNDVLVMKMAEALRGLADDQLGSGTARWGAYDRARLINYRDRVRPEPVQINANLDGIVHTPLDRQAAAIEQGRRRIVA